MKKSEMKSMMKPLIKECLQEMIFEEGFLSVLIKEVLNAQGKEETSAQKPQRSLRERANPIQTFREPAAPKTNNFAKMLTNAAGNTKYGNVFEGITPAPNPNNSGGGEGDSGIDLALLARVPGLKGFG